MSEPSERLCKACYYYHAQTCDCMSSDVEECCGGPIYPSPDFGCRFWEGEEANE